MSEPLPVLYLVRHGQTAWSLTGQHTGLTDIPLTAAGEESALRLGVRLRGVQTVKVFTSPLRRASKTCELAGFAAAAETDPDLVEWDYGKYEGRRTPEILADAPGWDLFRDGCPGGESPARVAARADRVVRLVRAINGNVLLFTSGHISRVLAARWLGLDPAAIGGYLLLSTASLSVLGYDRDLNRPVIQLWNETSFLESLSP